MPNGLWIPASIALLIGLRWLLGERHSVYRDEAQRFFDLISGLARAHDGGLVDRFVNLYLFNETYPPMFHVLAAPFVLASVDPVFGGRVYQPGPDAARFARPLHPHAPGGRKAGRRGCRGHTVRDLVIRRREPPLPARTAAHARGAAHAVFHRAVLQFPDCAICC